MVGGGRIQVTGVGIEALVGSVAYFGKNVVKEVFFDCCEGGHFDTVGLTSKTWWMVDPRRTVG